jgi:O-acetylserine/cysteine efflux transporter
LKAKDTFLAILVAMIWGLNFVVIKVGLDSFPPLLFSCLRFTVAAFPAVIFFKRGQISWKWILTIGLTLGVVKYSFLFIGIKVGTPAGLSSLLIQSQVLFTSLLSARILNDAPVLWQKIGIGIAFSGIGLIASSMISSANLLGFSLVLMASIAWSFANIFIKMAGNIDMFKLMIWMSIIPPLPLLALSIIFEEGQKDALAHINFLGIGTIFYTGLIATVLAFGIWGQLLKRYSANLVTPFALLVPVFGFVFSGLFLNERITTINLVASLLILIGLVLIVFGRKTSIKSLRSNM